VEWSGVEWSGVEWSGVEWSGVEWSGVEWRGGERKVFSSGSSSVPTRVFGDCSVEVVLLVDDGTLALKPLAISVFIIVSTLLPLAATFILL
jgi:hypothetical protein